MKKDELDALRGLIGGKKIKKDNDFKENEQAKKQMAALMGFTKKVQKSPPKVVVQTRQRIEKKLEKEEFPPQIKAEMRDIIGPCYKIVHGITINYFAVELSNENVRVSLATPAGHPSVKEMRELTREEFEKEFNIEGPKENNKASGPGTALGIYYKKFKSTSGSGSTAKECNLDLKYHATLLEDGAVQVAMATPQGRPTKIDVQKISKEEFDKEFTPEESVKQ